MTHYKLYVARLTLKLDRKLLLLKSGAVMPSGMVIKDAELRGVASSGMICSMKELNLPNAPEEKGIMVLNEQL